jgi:hypothetical protein
MMAVRAESNRIVFHRRRYAFDHLRSGLTPTRLGQLQTEGSILRRWALSNRQSIFPIHVVRRLADSKVERNAVEVFA